MALYFDVTEASEDAVSARCVDKVIDVTTGRLTKTPIDLTGKTVVMHYRITAVDGTVGSIVGPVTMTVRTPQTGDDLGWADYVWEPGEVTRGELEAQLTVTGGDGKPHKSTGTFKMQVGESLS